LAVLDGLVLDQAAVADELPPTPTLEARTYRSIAYQPPLYVWLASLVLSQSADRDPLATILPSYAAGAAVVILVYLHGKLWRGPGLGLVAAVLTGFNRHLLIQMQHATPTTLGLAGALAVLYCYGRHLRATVEVSRSWCWGGPAFWTILGGVAL